MAYWLVKEDPDDYAYDQLVASGTTLWDGVHHPLALRHIRSMAPGDLVFYYASGTERSILGIVSVSSPPQPDSRDARPSWFVEVRHVRRLARPVRLGELQSEPTFATSPLLRTPRLSVSPISSEQWDRVLALERSTGVGRSASPRGPPRRRRGSSRPRVAGSPSAGARRPSASGG